MYRETDSGILKFSPSDLTVFLETEFASWMDRWQVERSHGNHEAVGANGLPIGLELPGVDVCKRDDPDEQLELIAEKGMEHEKAYLERLRQEGHQIAELDAGSTDLSVTIDAMNQQKDFIFQAPLEHEIFGGFADFLVLKTGQSLLGEHHYEIWDTKLARDTG